MNAKQISRVMGGVWIFTSFSWAVLGVLGLIYGLSWLESTESKVDEKFGLLVDSLDAAENLVTESTKIISATHQSLDNIGNSTEDASSTLTDMRPLIWKTTKVVTEDVPTALEGVQDSMPSLIETAKSVDETLNWIANFQIVIPIPFRADYVFDFGISYAPEVPLDQALENMSGNLEGVPDDLRVMEEDLDNLDANLLIIRDDLSLLSNDIETLTDQIASVNPRLNALAARISDIEESFSEIQNTIPISFEKVKNILIGVMGLLLLTQIPSFYMGWLLIRGSVFSDSEEKLDTQT